MAIKIKIPKQGLTMKEATLVKWYVGAGQAIKAEQAVALVETDKVAFDIEATGNGLVYPVVPTGTVVKVAQTIGYIAADAAELAALEQQHPPDRGTGETVPAQPAEKTAPPATDTATPQPRGRIIASPLARRMAKTHGLDLSAIAGTGPGGRIIEVDIQQALAAPPPAVPPRADTAAPTHKETSPAQAEISSPEDASDLELTVAEEIPIQGIRKIIFRNMHTSLSTQAQLTLQTEVSAKGMQACRNRINTVQDSDAPKVSYNAIIVKAVAMSLRRHPHLNASVDGETINIWKQIHIGVAMDLGKGLIVPKIRNADTRSITDIAAQLDRLVDQAKQNTLLLDDLQAGTFTITNLGAWGVDHFTPIVNFPESAILGVGRIVETPCVENSQVVIEPRMALSLSFDHRIIDGAPGAKFLNTLTRMIEEPLLML